MNAVLPVRRMRCVHKRQPALRAMQCRLMFDSEKVDDRLQSAVGEDRHDDRCEDQAEEDRRNRFLSADMEQRCDQRAGPCAGTGQRNADKEQQSDELDLADLIRLFAGAAFLQPGCELAQIARIGLRSAYSDTQ